MNCGSKLVKQLRNSKYLRGGAWVVNSGGDEHAALAIDDDSPVVVAHIKRREEVAIAGADDH